jgi:hypothetical protein
MQAALVARKDVTVIWHLIHVLEKLEKGVERQDAPGVR